MTLNSVNRGNRLLPEERYNIWRETHITEIVLGVIHESDKNKKGREEWRWERRRENES